MSTRIVLLSFLVAAPAAAAPPSTETDAAGRVVRTSVDRDADGVPEAVVRWEYDDAGQRAKKLLDDDGDGGVDRVFFYDPGCVTPYDTCTGRFERQPTAVAALPAPPPMLEPEPHVPWGPVDRP